MIEIAANNYDHIRPLITASGMKGHLALVYEVLELRRPGSVWVDQVDHPQMALVCNLNGFFFAFGEPDREVLEPLLLDYFQLNLKKNYTAVFALQPNWQPVFRQILRPFGAAEVQRISFELHQPPPVPDLPKGYTLSLITEALAEKILDGSGTMGYGIDPWFIRIAGGAGAYAADHLGFALQKDGQIVSICGVCGMGYGEVELELGTVPQFRNQGLGQIAAAYFIEACRRQGLKPAYSCASQNLPSRAVAKHLGFVETETIQGINLFQE
jgi:RimJ/RimL family protein N-acetyltransferase